MRKMSTVAMSIAGLLASTSYAQSPASPAETPASSNEAADQPGEIIVTAQRKSESLQKTPIAVTAVTAEAVQSLGLSEIKDIAAITPGASFTTNSNFFAPYIRGIGTAYVSVGVEAPVAIYEDGAYLERTLGTNEVLDNFDIGSIQVLRGPQGSLYGRNATGGVILINSADPKQELEGRVRGEFGNLDHYSLNAMINMPLGEDLALRVSGGYKHDGDYVFGPLPGQDRGGGRAYNVRGKLRWNPENVDIILGGQYYNISNRMGLNTLGRNDLTCFGCQFFPAGLPANPGPHDYTSLLSVSPMKNEFYGANLSMKFQVGDFELSSVTTYRHQKVIDSVGDSDFIPQVLFEFNVPESGGKTLSQDLQISSGLDGRFNYLFGLSYLHDKAFFNPCLIGAGFGGSTSTADGFCADNSTTTKSYAAFVEGYYQITDNLRATVGGRYTYEQRSAEVLQRAFPPFFIPAFSISNEISQRAFTPRFVLAWNDGPTNIYYSFTRGFKAGGFPGPFFPGFGGGITTVQPEKIFSHEIGVKQAWLDNRVRLNAAAFYFKNKNQQSQTLDPLTSVATSRNSGAVENYGLEVEAQVVPMDGLTLGLNGAWQHARYKPFRDAALVCFDPTRPSQFTLAGPSGPLFPCSRDITGTPPPHAPKFSGSFNASYEFPIASWTGSLSGIAQYTSAILYYPGASGPLNYDRRGQLVLVNASGYVSPPGDHMRIGFYANNVFNKSYVDYRQTNAPWGLAFNGAKPRTYGLRVEYMF